MVRISSSNGTGSTKQKWSLSVKIQIIALVRSGVSPKDAIERIATEAGIVLAPSYIKSAASHTYRFANEINKAFQGKNSTEAVRLAQEFGLSTEEVAETTASA